MKFTAAGDMLIQRRVPKGYAGQEELAAFIQQGDARFFNLETTLNREGECCANQFSGGTYIRCNPDVLEDAKDLGFNMTTFNNNHALDFFYTGLEATRVALEESGLVHAGVGRNLAEASAPRYLETPNGRVALIAICTSFNPSAMAGEQSPRVHGRPGVNGIRLNERVELPQADLDVIRRIAEQSNINAARDIACKEGYCRPLPDGKAFLGGLKFVLGDTHRYVQECEKKDLERLKNAIYEAQLQADYIMISVHCHQVGGKTKENVPQLLQDLAHFCIDNGAHAVLGHGPHLLRPIEVYKDCPIFYSLGDFFLQLYQVELAPADFFDHQDLPATSTVHELLKKRSDDFTVGLMEDRRMYTSVVPLWETEGTKLKSMTLMPIEMMMDGTKAEQGLPRPGAGEEICAYLAGMCEPYGTKVTLREDGLISVTW